MCRVLRNLLESTSLVVSQALPVFFFFSSIISRTFTCNKLFKKAFKYIIIIFSLSIHSKIFILGLPGPISRVLVWSTAVNKAHPYVPETFCLWGETDIEADIKMQCHDCHNEHVRLLWSSQHIQMR